MKQVIMHDEIFLETDEEVTSAIEKIKKSKKKQISLILPRNAVLGQSIVNLKLIFKQASMDNKRVAIVSPDKIARNLAERVGFMVSDSAKAIKFLDKDEPNTNLESEKEGDENSDKPLSRQRFDIKAKETPESSTEENEADEAALTEEDAKDEEEPNPENELKNAGFSSQSIKNANDEEEPKSIDETPASEEKKEKVAQSPEVPASVKTYTDSPRGTMIPTRGNLRMYRQTKKRPMLTMLVALLLVLIGGGATAAMTIPKANVTVTVKAQPLNETVSTIVDVDATAVDDSKATIPGKVISLDQVTKSSAKATGKKDLGEKAKGTVTISNGWDDKAHTYAAGTHIRAKNGNEYLLTDDVTVPGASSSISAGQSVITPGKKDADVVALAAGDGYNIAATTFTFPNLPKAQQDKIYAVSNAAMTGGTTNIVTVATQSDIDKLTENTKSKNRDDSVAKIKEQAGDNVVLDKAIQSLSQDSSSSVAADSQADAVEVTVTGKYQVIAFTKEDHTKLLEKLLADKIPQGQTLVTEGDGVALDTSQFDLNLVTDKRLELTNRVKAFTVTQFDQNAIRRNLAGASPSSAESIVNSKIESKKVEYSISPSWWPRFPFNNNKINVQFRYAAKDGE